MKRFTLILSLLVAMVQSQPASATLRNKFVKALLWETAVSLFYFFVLLIDFCTITCRVPLAHSFLLRSKS